MSGIHRISLTHNFETAHRLSHPEAPSKCQSIHGHSWWVRATLEGPELDARGMLVEFGAFKRAWRAWLDGQVDHHLALHQDDPVAAALEAVIPGSRVLRLPGDPTTERLAQWIFERTEAMLPELGAPEGVRLASVYLQETRVNAAEYARISPGPPHAP